MSDVGFIRKVLATETDEDEIFLQTMVEPVSMTVAIVSTIKQN